MKLKVLLEYFENYYGELYTGTFLRAMTNYLEEYSADFYQAASEVIIKRFPRVYNKVPDVAIIEKNMDEIIAMMPKREVLPEPKYERTEEEREEIRNIIKQIQSNLKKPIREKKTQGAEK